MPIICIITGIFPPDIGGPATYLEKLVNKLKKRYKLIVITLADKPQKGDIDDYNSLIIRIRRDIVKPLRFFYTIYLIIRYGKKANFLYVNGLFIESFIANLILNKPIIYKIVGDLAWERLRVKNIIKDDIDTFQNKKYNIFIEGLKFLRRLPLTYANLIIAPSFYLKEIIKNWKIKEEKIRVIYNAVEYDQFQGLSQTKEDKFFNIITVGRLVPWKRIDELIKVIEEIENARLTVIGEGPCKEYLLELVESLNLQTRVRFLGKLPQQQVIKYIISCDVFVLNSEYEGLPHTLLEAMACGVPVIATRIGGIPEIIKHKENGILINKNDLQELKKSIFLLKERKDLCKKLVANAKKCIKEKFSYAKMIEDTLKVFDLLKGK